MGNRWSNSIALARQSLAILKGNPQLSVFPIVSGVLTIILTISFFVPAILMGIFQINERIPVVGYVVMGVFYFISYFIVIFFNSAMAYCANEALNGRTTQYKDGIQHASRHLVPILGWTLISSTVGLILQNISENMGVIGKLIIGLVGGAWNILTFFTVPYLVLEGVGPIDAIKSSASLLKRTWGEQVIGNAGIGIFVFLWALAPIGPIALSFFTQSVMIISSVIVCSLLYWLVLSIIASSLSGIYRTALYVYATTGQIPNGFSVDYIEGAFKSKPVKVKRF